MGLELVAGSVGRVPIQHTESWLPPQHHTDRLWWYRPVIPALGRGGQEDQKFKAALR